MLRGRGSLRRTQLLADVDQHAGITRQQPIVCARTVELPAGEVRRRQSPLHEMRCRDFQADGMTVRGRQGLDAGIQHREQRLAGPGFGLPAELPAGLNRISDIETQIDMAVIVGLNVLPGPHSPERRAQHLADDDRSIREHVVTAERRRIARDEVDIHARDDFPEPVRPDIGADRGIGGQFLVLRLEERSLKNGQHDVLRFRVHGNSVRDHATTASNNWSQ